MEVGFDVKELLTEIKNDIRAIDTKLELKADRDRVHALANDMAAMNLRMTIQERMAEDVRRCNVALEEHDGRLDGVEHWRNFVRGGFAVSGLFFTVIGGLMLWVLTQ